MPSVCVGRAIIFLYGCSLPRLMFYYTICQLNINRSVREKRNKRKREGKRNRGIEIVR